MTEARSLPPDAEHGTGSLRSPRALGWLQLGLSVLLLALTLAFIDVEPLAARVAHLHQGWLVAAIALIGVQIVVMAARWWYLARGLGVGLTYARALAEYALSTLLNQVLPGGVAGDAVRGVRHHRGVERESKAGRAGTRVVLTLVLDRLSGQLALWAVVAASAPLWWYAVPLAASERAILIGVPFAAVLVLALGWRAARRHRFREAVRDVWREGGRAAFTERSLFVHLGLSLALVFVHCLVFWCVARSLHVAVELTALLRIVPLVLVASSLPAFFAGWGVREAAAAALFQLSRLSPSDGASVSLVYGAVSLLGSVPGLLALRRRPVSAG